MFSRACTRNTYQPMWYLHIGRWWWRWQYSIQCTYIGRPPKFQSWTLNIFQSIMQSHQTWMRLKRRLYYTCNWKNEGTVTFEPWGMYRSSHQLNWKFSHHLMLFTMIVSHTSHILPTYWMNRLLSILNFENWPILNNPEICQMYLYFMIFIPGLLR